MAHHLSLHDEIGFSRPKETNYFCDDLLENKFGSEESYIASCFGHINNEMVVGEGSIWNVYSEVAVENILDMNPSAKFVVVIRHPADFFNSFYYHRLRKRNNVNTNQRQEWQKQKARTRGDVSDPVDNLCSDLYAMSLHLRRLYNKVDKDKVLVILYDDLVKDNKSVYEEVLRFLGVKSDDRKDFGKVNKNNVVKNRTVYRFVQAVHKFNTKVGLTWVERAVAPLVKRLVFKKKPTMSKDLRKEITDFYRDDIKALEQMTGKNLSAWLDV